MLLISEFKNTKLRLTSRIVLAQNMHRCYCMWTARSSVQNEINRAVQTPVSRENKHRLLLECMTVCKSQTECIYFQNS
jgi:hypothetical protein